MNGPRAAMATHTIEWKDVWSSEVEAVHPLDADLSTDSDNQHGEDPRTAALRLREALIRHDLLITGIDRIARMDRRRQRA